MVSLQASKSHSSKAPKSEFFPLATPSSHGSATHTTPVHTETASPHTPELQTTSTPPTPLSSQVDRMNTLLEGLYKRIFGFKRVLYSTNNQVQMRFIAIETQLDPIQQKLEDSL